MTKRFFHNIFNVQPPKVDTSGSIGTGGTVVNDPCIEEHFRRLVDTIRLEQGNYQPIFGVEETLGDSPRRAHLTENARLVERYFRRVAHKQQVRIVDVGSNAGYTTLLIAKTFPNIVGLEIRKNCVELCQHLARRSQLGARFYSENFLDLFEEGESDIENIDCVLFFNVIHQMIFHRGISYVTNFLGRLSRRVDVMILELATRQDYVQSGKDHLLPIVPEEILAECTDCDIEFVRGASRPVYILTRRKVRLANTELFRTDLKFGGHPDPLISRKYYYSHDQFAKLFRYTDRQPSAGFGREAKALRLLRDTGIAPRLHDWSTNQDRGSIIMERIYGKGLNQMLDIASKSPQLKRHITAKVLHAAAKIAEAGLYQNDFSSHNFMITSDGCLKVVDFEQAQDQPHNDHFAFLLWIINDMEVGSADSYKRSVYKMLRTQGGARRAPREHYPALEGLRSEPLIGDLIRDAEEADDWGAFARCWSERFAQHGS